MALKLAMLAAAGRMQSIQEHALLVTPADVEAALIVANRWRTYAHAFAAHVGQSDFERRATRCLAVLNSKGGQRVLRRDIAKRAHMEKRQLDTIEDTLVDRGQIRVDTEQAPSGPSTKYWSRVDL